MPIEPTTKGPNKRYGRSEQEIIKQELTDLFYDSKRVVSLLKSNKLDANKKIDDQVNAAEIRLDSLILSDPSLYQGIQKIYRNHGVEIPSHHVIDKGEVITIKKEIIKSYLNVDFIS